MELSRSLREHGIPVGTSEIADAARIAGVLGLQDRDRLCAGTASAFLRRAGDRTVFDQIFDLYLPAAPGERTLPPAQAVDELRTALIDALARNDREQLDQLAAGAVQQLGQVASGEQQQGYSSAQTISRLQPERAIAAAQQQSRQASDGRRRSGGGEPLSDRFDRDEMRTRVAAFRRRVESEALRRNTQVRSRERVARFSVGAALEHREFLTAGTRDLEDLRRQVDPLARKLAARLAARRAAGRGALDLRRTVRRSLATGGVPIDPAYRHRRRHRPDIVVLADLSGSVGAFSTFTMLLLQALHAQFRQLRAYGFVSSAADLTDLLRGASGRSQQIGPELARRSPQFTAHGTSSSYGTAFRGFVDGELDRVGPRSTVLVLGDARTNYGDPGLSHLRAIAVRARHVAWLNPEPARMWDTGDSVAAAYAGVVDMHECRNLDQLRTFVARVLPV